LVSIDPLRVRLDTDHASPNGSRPISQYGLVEQIALSVRRVVSLLRVIGQDLPVGGKRNSVDFCIRTRTIQDHVLMHVGQPSSNAADGPLQVTILLDSACLVSKMVDVLIPILQLDVPQVSSLTDQQIDCSHVQTMHVVVGGLGFLQQGGCCPIFQDYERV